jgi:thiaminase/transcriptional activator TenA
VTDMGHVGGDGPGPDGDPDASLSLRLWAQNADLAARALAHPFVKGLGDGSLPRPTFASFIAQDAFFLQSFSRSYALALSRSQDSATITAFTELSAGVGHELGVHASYAAQWGVDMESVTPWPATSAYTEFLVVMAATADIGSVCAAMAPCMRLYAWLGSSLDPRVAGPYGPWVRTYADPGFEALACRLEGLVDLWAADEDGAARAYRRAMGLELAFFDAASGRADRCD